MPTCDNHSEMKDPLDLVDDNNLFNKLGHGTADLGPGAKKWVMHRFHFKSAIK